MTAELVRPMTDADWDREVLAPIVATIPNPSLEATAFHEAGHAVVARHLGVAVHVVSIRPGESHLGVALHGPVGGCDDFDLGMWWDHPLTFMSAARSAAIGLAGYLAEAMVVPSSTEAAGTDDARGTATEAIARLSPSNVRLLEAAEADESAEDDRLAVWRLAEALTGSVGEATSFVALIRASTRRLVDDRADHIAAVARELRRTVVIDGDELDRIIRKDGPSRLVER